MIPTVKECYTLMDQYRMLSHIREHSIVVARIVSIISRALRKAGVDISVEKSVAGALLHDIAKTQSLQTGGDHAAVGREICLQHQFHEIADIVGEHVLLKSPLSDGHYSEKEIVYYADKRVLHTSVVSLEERLHDILERYGRNNRRLCRRIRGNFGMCEAVEGKLFSKLEFEPADVAERIAGGCNLSS